MVNITSVDLLNLASSFSYSQQVINSSIYANDNINFLSYNHSFITDILGPNVSSTLIANVTWGAFHEAGVYSQATNSIYITSNWAGNLSNPINVTILNLADNSLSSVRYSNIASGNGATAYYPPGTPANISAGQQVLFCDEGNFEVPSQLTLLDPSTNKTRVLLSSFMGRNFSSVNDVRQHPHTGDIWFTDARYGYWQYFRPKPSIPPQVYRFSPVTGVVQAVADDFTEPNGIEFSPDYQYVYVTDTGAQNFDLNMTRPATIYRFEFSADGKRLQNRQLFAYSDVGLPDGIHCDTKGNVYSSVADGVHVWNPEGELLGKFLVAGGSNNFAFVPGGMILFNAYRLFKITLAAEGREVKRDFGLMKG